MALVIDVSQKVLMALQMRKNAISKRGADYLLNYVTSVISQPDFLARCYGQKEPIEENPGFPASSTMRPGPTKLLPD